MTRIGLAVHGHLARRRCQRLFHELARDTDDLARFVHARPVCSQELARRGMMQEDAGLGQHPQRQFVDALDVRKRHDAASQPSARNLTGRIRTSFHLVSPSEPQFEFADRRG